jgi:hypothetical protein
MAEPVNISDYAVEAAARAMHDKMCWKHEHPEGECPRWDPIARLALEAAAPHLFAPVLALADEMDEVRGSIRGHVTTYQLRQALGVQPDDSSK